MFRLILLLVVGITITAGLAGVAYDNRHWILNNIPAAILDPVLGTALGFRVERNVMLPMRDGVRLSTDLFIPTGQQPPFATILNRTPYGKGNYLGLFFVRNGYAIAVQNMRGRFQSEGVFSPYRGDSDDSSDTVDWLARQSWSNGKVGTMGCSGSGDTQMLLARERNPRHAAMIAEGAGGAIGAAGGRYGYFGVFEGGIFNLASGFGWFLHNGGKTPGATLTHRVDVAKAIWALPVAGLVARHRPDPTDFDEFITRPLSDPYWRALGYISDEDRFATPALVVNTWHDQTVADTLALADLFRRNWVGDFTPFSQHVIIGPGNHCDIEGAAASGSVGELKLGKNAFQPYKDWYLAWFDYWLKGEHQRKPDLPPYRFYILGEDRWADSTEWPPQGVVARRFYLDGSAAANSVSGGGILAPVPPGNADRYDEIRYDPAHPVPSRGGPICCTGDPAEVSGPANQRNVESRDDVLVYTSPPLRDGLRIAGPLKADLYVSSSALDTDMVVKLVDVRPDGTALNIQEGALRMRYRNGFTTPELMQPHTVYRVLVDMRAIAYYLPPGHRLRIQVTSSNFPRLERNLNTGGNNFDETAGFIAMNRVYTNRQHASAIVIPEWPDRPPSNSATGATVNIIKK